MYPCHEAKKSRIQLSCSKSDRDSSKPIGDFDKIFFGGPPFSLH